MLVAHSALDRYTVVQVKREVGFDPFIFIGLAIMLLSIVTCIPVNKPLLI